MAYNTGNPSGSSDPRDLSDSSADIDTWATSTTADTHPDRLGTMRKTWRGMENEFEADQDSREAQFVQLMASGGYTGTGVDGAIEEYASGITVSAYKEIIRENGEFWRAAADTTLPYTTNGAGMPEGGAFVNVGDGVLRQDLVQPVATFNRVSDMVNASNLDVGRKARTLGYYSPGDGGGNDYEIVSGGTGTDDGGSFIDLDNGLQAKGLFSNGVQVRQFGGVGSNNIAPAIQAALAYGKFCAILEDDYVFEGEVNIPSDCLIWLHNPRITMTLDGENGRGFHFEDGTSNSHIVGTAQITAGASTLGSDGFRNTVFNWGPDYYVPDAPLGVYNCNIYGKGIEVECVGPGNVKVCAIASLTENVYVHGIRATGQSNFGFVAHWGGRGSHDTLTDATWHPHNIVFDNCEGYQSESGNWLRSFTFSAGGRCEIRNCKSDSMNVSFNLFVGDYGYTYAQNIAEEDQFQYQVKNCKAFGAGAASACDAISSNLNGSPTWTGSDYRARVDIDGLYLNGELHDTGLLLGVSGLDVWDAKNVEVYDPNESRSREWFYPQQCNTVRMQADVLHNNRARIRTTKRAYLNLDYRQPVPTPDTTSYAVAMEGVDFMEVSGILRDSRFGVITLPGSGTNKYLKVNCDFEDIGLSCVDSDADFTHISGGNGENLGTTATTVNIYPYNIKSPGGFIVRGLSVISSEARYIVYIDDAAANGVIDCNFFGGLNASATSPAAIFYGGGSDVYIDPNTNIIAGDVPKLVHP